MWARVLTCLSPNRQGCCRVVLKGRAGEGMKVCVCVCGGGISMPVWEHSEELSLHNF